MNKILLVAVIVLPIVMFLAFFGNNILINFIENENDMIEAENVMKRTLVGGDGWTSPGGWSVAE
ncbi:MAG: hypothetical protein ACU0BB_06465 [Paracoccaceae bacterium]